MDKDDIADLKRVVWHKSFEILLEKLAIDSVTGVLMKCGDGQFRRVFPFIFILAADYE